jgi:hypothetical protein
MPPRVRRRSPLLATTALLLAAACSSGSSGGSAPAPTPTNPHPRIDRAAVSAALSGVLTGLRAATSISATDGISRDAAMLQHASDDLDAAGNALNPSPTGVPEAVSLPVSTGLLRISGLLHTSATCLAGQAHAASPATKPCLPPLRQANAKTGSLAHALVSLAAFGTQSPKSFESDLVNALQHT